MSKRPWKKHAQITRVELNNGDVKFHTICFPAKGDYKADSFEDLTSAETHLDAWWADWWPKQIKSSRRA